MRLRSGPRLAPLIFSLVVVLAIGAVAWGATRNKSTGHGLGSAKNQAAAEATLLTRLPLPAGLVRDSTFTACGSVADACLTSNAGVPATLTSLTTVMHAAGGSLPGACTTFTAPASGANVPAFTCAVQGELKGAEVVFLLGDGWLLPGVPGHPTPRTAVLANVVTGKDPAQHTSSAGTPVDVADLLPAAWSRAAQPCAGGSTPPASAPGNSVGATPSPSAPPLSSVVTALPLPACAPNANTDNVAIHLPLSTAAAQLSALALSKGFRLDGHPCNAGATPTSCGVWGERISSGVQELFVATLTDDGRGDTIGTLSVSQQS
jgi:hypothetical protein